MVYVVHGQKKKPTAHEKAKFTGTSIRFETGGWHYTTIIRRAI